MTTLTQTMKATFVNAVMNDLPKIEDRNEKIAKLVREDIESRLIPPDLLKLAYANHGGRRSFFNIKSWTFHRPSAWMSAEDRKELHYTRACLSSVSVLCPVGTDPKPSEEVRKQVALMVDAWDKELTDRRGLHLKFTQTLAHIRTIKALKEAFPEFEKYMPEESPAFKSMLPAHNIVAELAKAGWPATKSKPKTAPARNVADAVVEVTTKAVGKRARTTKVKT